MWWQKGLIMAIDHEAHKIRIKAVSDKMNHPMEYNDAGAPKVDINGENYGHTKKGEAWYRKKFPAQAGASDRERKDGRRK